MNLYGRGYNFNYKRKLSGETKTEKGCFLGGMLTANT